MKKYIRAKDYLLTGIFEVQEEHFIKEQNKEQVLTEVITKETMINPVMRFAPKQIEKSADTIEELCDCFIAVDKNGNLCENPMIAKGHCFKSFCNYYKANGIDVDCYLAILADKGLIYVAKMNDKGELELL